MLDIDDGHVRFRWKDYRDGHQQNTMTVAADEFIRRFLLHVLPAGFHRIRYYGFLGNRDRHEKLARCQHLLGMMPPNVPPSESAPMPIGLALCRSLVQSNLRPPSRSLTMSSLPYFGSAPPG